MEENYFTKSIAPIAIPIGSGLLWHPITHCRVLMQLGFEPDPPYKGHNLLSLLGLGQKVMKYPSVFTYSLRVVEQVGWTGLFLTGLPAKICYTNLSSFVTDTVYCRITQDEEGNTNPKKNLLDTDKPFKEYLGEMAILAGARLSGVIVSYPIEVIMIRQMAQMIDDEVTVPLSVLSWFTKILKDEGVVGFYGGVSSKILGELMSLSVAALLLYGINNYLISKVNNDDMKQYTPSISNLIAAPLAYKYSVISALLAISGSGISFAIPLTGFGDAYSYLRRKRGFNRGSSLLMRYAQ